MHGQLAASSGRCLSSTEGLRRTSVQAADAWSASGGNHASAAHRVGRHARRAGRGLGCSGDTTRAFADDGGVLRQVGGDFAHVREPRRGGQRAGSCLPHGHTESCDRVSRHATVEFCSCDSARCENGALHTTNLTGRSARAQPFGLRRWRGRYMYAPLSISGTLALRPRGEAIISPGSRRPTARYGTLLGCAGPCISASMPQSN